MPVETRLYDVLGVSPTANAGEIKRAYHKKSLACHPDKNPPERQEEASREFQEVGHAFEILSDDDARAQYDAVGEQDMRAGGAGGGPGADDLDDIFASMFGGGMGGMGGGRGPRRPQPRTRRRAPPTTVEYGVSLEDLYVGRRAHFHISRNIFCPSCQGSGARPGCKAHECAECKGSGSTTRLASMGGGMVSTRFVECASCKGEGIRVREKERCKRCKGSKLTSRRVKLDVDIQPGMRDGQRLVFREQSDCVPGCEKPGHLVMVLRLKPSETEKAAAIEIQNNDMAVHASITLSEALLGFHRAVFTHLDGRAVRVRSRPGHVVRPGDVSVVRGEGMPGRHGARTGDLYIRWTIDFPRDDFLSQLDVLKLESLLPPKRADSSRGFASVSGKVAPAAPTSDKDTTDERQEGADEQDEGTESAGLGRVQDVEMDTARANEFGLHALPPLEDDGYLSDDDDDVGGPGGQGAGCVVT